MSNETEAYESDCPTPENIVKNGYPCKNFTDYCCIFIA